MRANIQLSTKLITTSHVTLSDSSLAIRYDI